MIRFGSYAWVLAGVVMLAAATAAQADSARSLVLEGNEAYKAASYDDALKSYEQAIESDPLAAEARFNRGAALYRRNDWAGALDSFESAAALSRADGDTQLEAASKYNVGNVFFRQGEQASENDPRSAVEALRQSVASYRDALRLDPKLTNAARNIEIARREMKRLIELAKQQPPGGPSDDKKGDNENELSEKIKKNLEQQQQLNKDRDKVANQQNSPQQQQQASELADRQQDLKEQTEDLAKQAEQQQQPQQQDAKERTQQHLDQAAQQQQKAAQELERNQLQQAQQSQGKAEEELQKALQASQGRPEDREKKDSEQQQQSAQNASSEGAKNQASSEPATMPAAQALRQEPQDLLDEERANRKRRQLLLLGAGEKVEKDW